MIGIKIGTQIENLQLRLPGVYHYNILIFFTSNFSKIIQ